ncbi:MAG: hypothetical protein FJ109_13030 [Deltaproteobacteria bacterium]|nr:hypothetical protein [Deltaproteobacteria bacterium]
MYILGENFVPDGEGRIELAFEGNFERMDGIIEASSFTVSAVLDAELTSEGEVAGIPVPAGTQVLRLSRFGPYEVPFTKLGNQTGTFKGTLSVRNLDGEGGVLDESDPTHVTLKVKPSIAIRKLEPFVGFNPDGTPVFAGCGTPALRALQNLPYALEVEAVGFEPDFFVYEFQGVNGKTTGTLKLSHPAKGRVDSIGTPESKQILVFNEVPEDMSFYYAGIRVTATVKGKSGDFVETALPISVHRPMEFHLGQSKSRPAEYYEPDAVSGCMPGAIGSSVTYQESHSESRQNAVSVSVAKSWNQSHGVGVSQTWSQGIQESSSVTNEESESWSHSESETLEESYGVNYEHSESQNAQFHSEDGESWEWSYNQGSSNEQMQQDTAEVFGEVSVGVETEVSAEGSIPGFAKVGGKVGTSVGTTVGGSKGTVVGQTVGISSSKGASMGGSHTDGQSFGSTTTDSTGESVNKGYALTSQDEVGKSTSKQETTGTTKVYDFGGATSMEDVVSVGSEESWNETWSTTQEDSTLMSYSGKIPVGRYGVWYRQTTRYVRQAQVYSYNLCGVRELMGNLTFNEWAWAPALAIGDECGGNEMPRPDFPQAQCIVPPCN